MNITRTLLTTALLTGLTVPALADHSGNGPAGNGPYQPDADRIEASLSPVAGITGFGRADYAIRTAYAQDSVTVTGNHFHVDVGQSYTADPTSTAPSTLTVDIDTTGDDYQCSLPLESIGQNMGRGEGRKGGGGAPSSAWVAKYELSVFSVDGSSAYAQYSGAYCTTTTDLSTWVVPQVAAGDAITVTDAASTILFSGNF